MKRDRSNIEIPSPLNSSSKKIHYPIGTTNVKERIYRCTYKDCEFIACTPHNVKDHASKKHKENKN